MSGHMSSPCAIYRQEKLIDLCNLSNLFQSLSADIQLSFQQSISDIPGDGDNANCNS
jgi:hypothetical protein